MALLNNTKQRQILVFVINVDWFFELHWLQRMIVAVDLVGSMRLCSPIGSIAKWTVQNEGNRWIRRTVLISQLRCFSNIYLLVALRASVGSNLYC
jgi:hypothetical protein